MWFFKEMGYFNNNLRLYLLIMVSFLLIWIIESMMQRTFSALNLRFSIFYSFIVVLKSIHTVNDLVITETQSITKSALFWICIGFIAYFSFKVLINTFWLYGLSKSKAFLLQMAYIMVYINLFTNLIYAFAVLWIPKRQPSIRLF
jgi:ABC-type taurine transport system ATPase subunit